MSKHFKEWIKDDAPEITELSDTDFLIILSGDNIKKIAVSNLNFGGGSNGGNSGGSTGTTFTYVSNGDDNGIIYWLGSNGKTTAFSNPAVSQIIQVSSLSQYDSNHTAEKLFGRDTVGYWSTNANPNNWVKIDFKLKKIKLISYTAKGAQDDTGYIPRNWKIQGSNDESNWIDLDVRSNDSSIVNNSSYALFACNQTGASDTAYRFLRWYQTGVDSSNTNYLELGELEFYGVLI